MVEANVIALAGSVIALLLSGNLFFIKRLVDKIDLTSKAQEAYSTEVSNLSQCVAGVSNQLREIKLDIKELRRIEIEVAVLKAQQQQQQQNKPIHENG